MDIYGNDYKYILLVRSEIESIIHERYPDLEINPKNLIGQDDFSDILKMRPILGTGFYLQIEVPFIPILRFDYGWGFYDGKQVDKAFHIAAQHMI